MASGLFCAHFLSYGHMIGFIAPLFRFSYWFHLMPQPFEPWASTLVLVVMLVLVGIGLFGYGFAASHRLKDKDDRQVVRRAASCALWAGIVGFMLYAFTWMYVPLFSMRFWFVIWFFSFAWWAYTIGRFALQELPARRAGAVERASYEKWLPKPKR